MSWIRWEDFVEGKRDGNFRFQQQPNQRWERGQDGSSPSG